MAGNNPTLYGYVHDTNSWVDVQGLTGIFSDELADMAKQVHDLSPDKISKANSTVAIARVEVDGQITLYAARSGEKNFTQTQIAKLKELGVPEENIITVPRRKPNPRVKGDKSANHAERIIERNISRNGKIREWGISWASKQKNEMCPNCKKHFNCH